MNGIEMGNIFGSMAAGQQKNRPSEVKNVRAARTIQEASVKYERAGQTENAKENGVSWIRSGGDVNATKNANNPPRSYAGNRYGTGHRKNQNNIYVTGKNNSSASPELIKNEKSDFVSKETAAENKATNQTGLHGQTTAGQAGKKGQNAVGQNGKNSQDDAKQIGKNDQNVSTSLFSTGQTNLSMVDRQRIAQQKKAKAKAKKKNLNYNRREVSAQVLRANKLGTAARALATARTKVSSLRRSVGTGQYDENELRIAIAHAESIVKTAKKKLSNLKEEHLKEKRVSREKQENALKKQVKRQRVRAKRQQIKRELSAQRSQAERQMKAKELRVKQLKRRHRGEELADVAEADIKYIKDMDRYRRYGGTESSSRNVTDTTGTAALEIGNSAMRLNDLERAEQALKYEEQQMGQGTADFYGSSASGIDYSVSDKVSDGISAGGGNSVSGGEISVDTSGAAVGGAVDISL